MNETLSIMKSRRSIKNFQPEQIKDTELEAILEAGAYAPSASNQQAWHFTVIQKKSLIDKLLGFTFPYGTWRDNKHW